MKSRPAQACAFSSAVAFAPVPPRGYTARMNARLARFQVIAFLIVAVLALPACGNKGPLVLPDEPAETAAPVEAAAPADTAPAGDAGSADEPPADTTDEADPPVAAPPPEDD